MYSSTVAISRLILTHVWLVVNPLALKEGQEVQIACTYPEFAIYTPAQLFARRLEGLVKLYKCTEHGVSSSNCLGSEDPM